MKEFNDGNCKRRWTYISRKLGKHYTPGIVEYRILLLNAINNINQGMEPDIEGQDPLDLYDEDLDADKMGYKEDNVNRRRITFRYESDEVKEIPRNLDSPFISDDISLTTDESQNFFKRNSFKYFYVIYEIFFFNCANLLKVEHKKRCIK